MALLGLIDEQMAKFLEVDVQTFNTWKHKYPSFLESLTKGKIAADANVAEALYKRATGYSYKEEEAKVVPQGQGLGSEIEVIVVAKHQPPSDIAAIHWLKNRQNKLWRDKQEQDITHKGIDISITKFQREDQQ